MKTRKTLAKRVKITSTGKVMTKQSRTGHLKSKMDSSRKFRKGRITEQTNKAQVRRLKRLLGTQGKRI
jgi:ribosomal protein L35